MRAATSTRSRSIPWSVGALVVIGALLVVSAAHAAAAFDLRGKWLTGGTNGSSGDLSVTSYNRATGVFTGTSFGGMFRLKIVEQGKSVTMTQSAGSYVATDVGTVSGGGKRMSGTWHDTNGTAGTWFANKTSTSSKHKHKTHKHKTHKHKHKTHKHKTHKHKTHKHKPRKH